MEVLLLAAIAWAMGQQSEQSKLGLTPAHRAQLKEQHRHEKAVRKITAKHGTRPPTPAPLPGAAPAEPAVTIPGALRSGYRAHTPVERVATPLGRRAGGWTAQGVAWAKDTGRGAVREYRKRRRTEGHKDPAPVVVPPPRAGERPEGTRGVSLERKKPAADEAPEGTPEPLTAGEAVERPDEAPADSTSGTGTAPAAEKPVAVPGPRKPQETPDETPEASGPAPSGEAAPGEAAAKEETTPAPDSTSDSGTARNGVGRMAAEVSYDSVMDESDELSLMCDDDVQVYDRIGRRCEREIGRADVLIADARNAGVGESVTGWISRALEKYQGIHSSLDDLKANTIAQGEKVVKAKELLEVGQGLYADIAVDMDDVADREFYVSDAVDSEDTSASSETYETRGA